MAQQTQSRPGSQNEDDQNPDVGYGGYGASGDPSDPRGDLPPGASMGSADDPNSGMRMTPGQSVYDDSGSQYDNEEESSKLDKLRKGAKVASNLHKGASAANKVRKGLKRAENRSGRGDAGEDDASPSDLNDAEDEGDSYNPDDDEGGFFNANDKDSRRSRAGKFLKKHKKKGLIGGGIMGGVVGGGLGLFLLLLPLKIEHIVSNLQGSFFSSSQQALSTETRNMVKNYLITRVMPGYKSCGSTIKAGCSARKFGTSPVANMYRSWADARVESSLADHGITLEYKRLSGKWYLETPDIKDGSVDIGKNGEGLAAEIDNHADLRAALDKTIKDETKWYQVYTRYKWGRYFERKFGLPRCVITCKLTGGTNPLDPLHTSIKDKKIAAKLILTQRVITPHDQTLGIALECLITDCAATDNQPSGTDGENGTPESEVDTKIKNALVAYGGPKLTNVSEDELLKTYKDINEQGLQKYLVSKALTPIIGDTAAGTAGDVIPIAGWVNLAAQIVNAGNDAGGTLKKLRFDVNGAAEAAVFATWLVYADEIHTGHADATELGSFSDSLGPGDQGSTTGPPTGGVAGAEQTKLYQNLVEGKSGGGTAAAATASAGNLLTGTAYADTASDITSGAAGEVCNTAIPVPANQLICPEDFLGGGNSIANGIHDFLNLPGNNVIVAVAQGWRDSFGLIFNFAGGILGSAFNVLVAPANASCSLPSSLNPFAAYCAAKSATEKAIPALVKGVTTALIPDPLGVPMGGGRQFVLGAGGADYLGNDSAHRILGAQAITPAQKAQIVDAQTQEDQQQFSHQSFFARMFNGDSQYSLVSKLAMDIPFGNQGMAQSGFAALLNPFGSLSSSFGSIFSGKASADTTPQDDPFGITQYGYPAGTIPNDPETYWKNHCVDDASVGYQKGNVWNKAASGSSHADPNTGEPLNKKTNPCLLIMATVGADGGLFDTSNLTQDDLADLNGGAGSPAPSVGSGNYQNPFSDSSNLSATRVDEGVDYTGSGPVHFLGNAKVTYVCASGCWEGESFITYQLLDGPASNKYVYVAEGCTPASGLKASATKTYTTSDVVCNMYNGPHGIETGWAAGATGDVAAAHDVYVELSSGKSYATAYGQNFEELMESLGVKTKACYDFPDAQLSGTLPHSWPTWTTNPATKAGSNSCG